MKKKNTSKLWIGAFVAMLGLSGLLVRFGAIAAPVEGGINIENVEVLNLGSSGSDDVLGGLIHNIQESFDAGIAVDGTEIIDGDGNFRIGGTNASTLDFVAYSTTTLDVDNLTAGSTTSSSLTVTGAKSNDSCQVTTPFTASSTVVQATCFAASDSVTLTFFNASTSAFNPASGVFGVHVVSDNTN